ncbi:MAG: sulfotransferase domain-containing protein [Rubrobacteraceae bacterium]
MSIFENHKTRAARKARSLLSGLAFGKRARRQLAGKDREIAALRRELAGVRGLADGAPTPDPPPVFFVVGYQKSGTTWLMEMLDAHHEILCRGEGRPFGRDFRKEKRSGYPPTSLSGAIAGSEDLRRWIERSVWTRGDDADEHLDNLTRLAVEYFLTRRLSETGKKLVGDKTVLLGPEMVAEISEICPEAKVIHIIRDGRDVVVSATHHVWNQAEDRGGTSALNAQQRVKREAYRENVAELLKTDDGMFVRKWLKSSAERWNERVGRAAEDGASLLGANYAEVRYEDLLTRPEQELGRLLRFLGADADERTVSRCVEAVSFEKLSKGRKPGQEAASFYRKGVAGDWKNVFTERNRRDFEEKAGDLLVKLGYEKSHDW